MKKLYIVMSLMVLLLTAGCKPEPYIIVEKSDYKFDCNAATDSVIFTTNYAWTTQTYNSWITVSPATGATARGVVKFQVSQNKTYGAREGTFAIHSVDGQLEHIIRISQAQNDTLVLNYDSFTVPSTGGTVAVNVITNVDFEVEIDCNWITQSKALSSKMVYLEVDAAPDKYSSREGKVYINSKDSTGLMKYRKEITITQQQDNYLSLAHKLYSVETGGETFDVDVTTNIPYRVIIPPEYASWVKEVTTKALHTDSYTFTVSPNTTHSWRNAYILFVGTTTSLTDTVKITQDQTNYMQLEQELYQLDSKANTIDVAVNTNVGISYKILDGAQSWLSIVATKALSDKHFNVATASFAGSETEVFRSGRIVFYNTEKNVSDTLTVVQTAEGVYYVRLASPGTLSTYFESSEYSKVQKIIVTGTVRDNDIIFIRDNLRNVTHIDFSQLTNTSLPYNSFYNNSDGMPLLKRVVLPPALTTINHHAFTNCTKLADIVLPSTMTSIGQNAFSGCTSLKSINLPNGITTIESNAFTESGLTSIVLPNSLSTISQALLKGCTSLASVTIGSGVTGIGIEAFYGTGLKSVVIPSNVNSIAKSAFYQCPSLVTVVLPDKLTTLDAQAFAYCTALTSVNIPTSFTSINNNMFRGCTALKTITIPAGITKIDYNVFSDCSSLELIICNAATPPTLASDPFSGVNKEICVLRVPAGSVETYKATYMWQQFVNITE